MDDIFFRLLLGHLFGDYVFQTAWMADNKKTDTFPCAVHCLLYSLCVMVFVPEIVFAGPLAVILLYASHFVFDRWQLVMVWFSQMRSVKDAKDPSKAAILTLVYVMMDNTFHLFFMWLILKLFVLK